MIRIHLRPEDAGNLAVRLSPSHQMRMYCGPIARGEVCKDRAVTLDVEVRIAHEAWSASVILLEQDLDRLGSSSKVSLQHESSLVRSHQGPRMTAYVLSVFRVLPCSRSLDIAEYPASLDILLNNAYHQFYSSQRSQSHSAVRVWQKCCLSRRSRSRCPGFLEVGARPA